MTRAFVLGSIVGGVLAGGSAQACNGDHFSLNWGNTTEVGMRVTASENCRFGFKVGGANHLESVVIAQAPQHGPLTQDDRSHFFYRPSNGYTGPDVLRITATGDLMGDRHVYSGDMNVTYNIQVLPLRQQMTR